MKNSAFSRRRYFFVRHKPRFSPFDSANDSVKVHERYQPPRLCCGRISGGQKATITAQAGQIYSDGVSITTALQVSALGRCGVDRIAFALADGDNDDNDLCIAHLVN